VGKIIESMTGSTMTADAAAFLPAAETVAPAKTGGAETKNKWRCWRGLKNTFFCFHDCLAFLCLERI